MVKVTFPKITGGIFVNLVTNQIQLYMYHIFLKFPTPQQVFTGGVLSALEKYVVCAIYLVVSEKDTNITYYMRKSDLYKDLLSQD